VYSFLALVTLAQPCSVASLSLSVPVPGLLPARLFGLPDRPFTVMIVGLDIRPTQDGPSRTDSILLLRVDPGDSRAGMLSIPRDTMMQVPFSDGSLTQDRVNTAFVYNWSADDGSQAPEALANTIAKGIMRAWPVVDSVTVRVRKPHPPVRGVVDHVEVEITNSR